MNKTKHFNKGLIDLIELTTSFDKQENTIEKSFCISNKSNSRHINIILACDLFTSTSQNRKINKQLLELHRNNLRFRVSYEKVILYFKNKSRRKIDFLLTVFFKNPNIKQLFITDISLQRSLINDYKIAYGDLLYQDIIKSTLKTHFNEKRIKQWLNKY